MVGGGMAFLSFDPFSDARMSLLCSQLIFLERATKLLFKFLSGDVFFGLQVSFHMNYYTFAEEPHNLFWTRLKEEIFAFVGKPWEYLECRDFLYIHRPESLIVLRGMGYKTLRE